MLLLVGDVYRRHRFSEIQIWINRVHADNDHAESEYDTNQTIQHGGGLLRRCASPRSI